jgi:hypothetical protein
VLAQLADALPRSCQRLADVQHLVDHYRRLAAERPDAFLPDLAMSLNNLAVDLGGLGGRSRRWKRSLRSSPSAADSLSCAPRFTRTSWISRFALNDGSKTSSDDRRTPRSRQPVLTFPARSTRASYRHNFWQQA